MFDKYKGAKITFPLFTNMTQEKLIAELHNPATSSPFSAVSVAATADVATAVAFLASDSSKMITGTSILIDGGWTAI